MPRFALPLFYCGIGSQNKRKHLGNFLLTFYCFVIFSLHKKSKSFLCLVIDNFKSNLQGVNDNSHDKFQNSINWEGSEYEQP